jgi:hypothetical protein
MSDAVELKKLVKQLQTTSTNEVCAPERKYPAYLRQVRAFADCFLLLQDITNILRTLKKDFKVNEAILRVRRRPPCAFFSPG